MLHQEAQVVGLDTIAFYSSDDSVLGGDFVACAASDGGGSTYCISSVKFSP